MRLAWLAIAIGCGGNNPTIADAPVVAIDAPADAPIILPLATVPASQSFGMVGVGITSLSYPVLVQYTGTTGTDALTVAFSSPDFTLDIDGCTGMTLAMGSTCQVWVTFAPASLGVKMVPLAIGDGTLSTTAILSGTGIVAANVETIAPMKASFAASPVSVMTAPTTLTITNVGAIASSVPDVELGGMNHADFAITSDTCMDAIPPHGSCTVGVAFQPTSTGARTAHLLVTTESNSVDATLAGTATIGTVVAIAPTAQAFGSVVADGTSKSMAHSFTISDPLDTATGAFGVTLGGSGATSFSIDSTTCTGTLAPGDTCAVVVTFIPQAFGNLKATLVVGGSIANLTGVGTM